MWALYGSCNFYELLGHGCSLSLIGSSYVIWALYGVFEDQIRIMGQNYEYIYLLTYILFIFYKKGYTCGKQIMVKIKTCSLFFLKRHHYAAIIYTPRYSSLKGKGNVRTHDLGVPLPLRKYLG